MDDPAYERFLDARFTYERVALPELGAARTLDAVRLIEAVNGCLDGGGVLCATEAELEAAIGIVLAQEENPGSSALLRTELERFRGLAVVRAPAARHPANNTGRGEPAGARTALPDRHDVAKLMTGVVANLIEEGLNSALLLNPLADPVSKLGEEGGVLDQTAEHLGKRWRILAHRLRKPLGIFRIAFPVAVLLVSLNSLFSCSGPLGTRTRSAIITGAGVDEVRKFVRDMDGLKIGDPKTIDSFQEITERTGRPTALAASVFRLRRVFWGAVYLEHIQTGKAVVIDGRYIGSFDHNGTWRIVE